MSYLETYKIFSKTDFEIGWYLWKTTCNTKNLVKLFFPNSHLIFCVIFLRFFDDFSLSFQYFLKQFSALKFPVIATAYFAYYSRPNVESIKLKTIIEEKWDKTKEGKNAKLFIKLFAFSGLESNYDLLRLQSC